MITRRAQLTTLALAAIAALSIIGVACGDDDDDSYGGGSTPAATQPAAATEPAGKTPEATAPATGGTATIVTRDAGALGTILTTTDGYTLYTFDNDVAGSGTSACTGGCTSAWPPLPVANPTASGDATGELGSITRDDGSPQATYNGKPLYLFASDAAPGDTNGDGAGGVWHAAKP